jgi:tRNA threonylcarbamoyladenosine biosynthesis protein TsaE
VAEIPVVFLQDENAMVSFGEVLAAHLQRGMLMTLKGDLGAGKTTLCRGLLRGLGHQAAVKSPTYTIVEPYQLPFGVVYHFDLYRVRDPQELDYIGFTDYLDNCALSVVEWPEHGSEYLNKVDVQVVIGHRENGRTIGIEGCSELGKKFVDGVVESSFFSGHTTEV